jgi:hypothetical protein
MDYDTYIASSAWKAKRIARLSLDGNRCVVCKHDGSAYRLEVHHIHYENFGNENVTYDLMTVCSRCHKRLENIRRAQVHAAMTYYPTFVESVSARMENQNGVANPALQVDFLGSVVDAQRANSRPAEQMVACNQEDYVQSASRPTLTMRKWRASSSWRGCTCRPMAL